MGLVGPFCQVLLLGTDIRHAFKRINPSHVMSLIFIPNTRQPGWAEVEEDAIAALRAGRGR